MKKTWLLALGLIAGTVHAAIPAEAQSVLDALGGALGAAQIKLAAGDAAGAQADLDLAVKHKATFQSKFAGRLGPVKEFREYNSRIGKLQGELKALQAGGAVAGSASTALPPRTDTADRASSDGPAAAATTDTSARVSSSGPAAAVKGVVGAIAGSVPGLPGRPAAGGGGRNANLLAEWNASLESAEAALTAEDYEAARRAASDASYRQRDCDTSSACRALPEFAALKERTDAALDRAANRGSTAAAVAAGKQAAHSDALVQADLLQALSRAEMEADSGPLNLAGMGRSFLIGNAGLGAGKQALDDARQLEAGAQALRKALGAYQAGGGDVGHQSYLRIVAELENLPKARDATVELLLKGYQNELEDIDGFYAPAQAAENLAAMADDVALAVQIAPENEALNALNASMAERKAAFIEKQQAKIDAGTWPQRSAFDGPGSAAAIEKAAMEMLRNDKAWGKNPKRPQEILAVVVQGPWQEAEWNLLGQVVSWRVPMKVAITDAKLKPQGVAQVFDISMVTPAGAAGRAPGLPFDGAWVGGNYYMRIAKLP